MVNLLQLLGNLADTYSFELVVLAGLRRGLVSAVLEWRSLATLGEDARIPVLGIVEVKGVHSAGRIELRVHLLVYI